MPSIDPLHNPTNSGPSSQEVLNDMVLRELVRVMGDDGKEGVTRMINSLLNYIPALLEEIQAAFVAEDLENLRRTVHGLKGNCAMYGAVGMVRQCIEIEDAIDREKVQRLGQQVASLAGGYERLKEELLQWKQNLNQE